MTSGLEKEANRALPSLPRSHISRLPACLPLSAQLASKIFGRSSFLCVLRSLARLLARFPRRQIVPPADRRSTDGLGFYLADNWLHVDRSVLSSFAFVLRVHFPFPPLAATLPRSLRVRPTATARGAFNDFSSDRDLLGSPSRLLRKRGSLFVRIHNNFAI